MRNKLIQEIEIACGGHPEDCLSFQGQEKLLTDQKPLLRRWITATLERQKDELLPSTLLAIIESQLPGFKVPWEGQAHNLADKLRKLGFQVIPVPKFGEDPPNRKRWAGVSYANGLLIKDTLFVPRFGLGDAEDKILEEFQGRLPAHYRVEPLNAQFGLLNNGGIHCTMGIVRRSARPDI